MGARSPRPGALQPLTSSEFSGGRAAVSLFLFWPQAGAPGGGQGERARGEKENEWIKEKKNNPSLRMGLGPGRPLGVGGEGQSRSARPGGPWAGPAGGGRVSGLPASRRGPAVPLAGSGVHRWRPGARRRQGEAAREPDSGARLHCCCGRGKGEQNSFRSPGSRALEPFQAGPRGGGNGRAVGAGSRAVRRRSVAAWWAGVFFRAPGVPAEPDEPPAQVMRGPRRPRRGTQPPLDASIV